ncbi:MAG: class I SAM-dependent DNA methyltransferase [Treponema sp.]|nr:class I SAM-dependent DNA methyltransferase [Treponema sp.]
MLSQQEQQKAAKKFSEDWKDKGYEKGESQKFWLDLLCNVYGIQDFSNFISFEDQVKLDHTSFIDGYIPQTKVLIEQKSIDKDLRAPIKQSDGTFLNPFQQAKRYITELPVSKHPRWVVTSNFKSFLVYDMENPNGEPEEILLENLEKEFYRLSFITDTGSVHLKKELEISKKAGDIIGEIYDAILAQYKDAENPSPTTLRSLNMLCVRIVFCLYAEDAGIFGHKSIFGDYLKQFESKDLRRALLDLFQVLDQKTEERDEYLEESLAAFPYVNGGLFTEEDKTIPPLTEEIKELLVKHASSEFDWSEISPTIFGAIFESTLNPETRRSGGMHYTSIENIHKVIDPLFLDDLKAEFETLKEIKSAKTREQKVIEFQKKIGSLKFLDPACGSGNFLTETYLSLRKLENKCLKLRFDQSVLDVYNDTVFVNIHQFYGIEINDFAAVVAKTALWIAESQMMKETSNILGKNLEFLPLKSYANIIEGNALRVDWESVVPKNELSYILGNPPFVGARLMSESQKEDVISVWGNIKNIGNVDYVSCWYKKATDLMKDTNIKTALVSTNSITQGEQVAIMWKPLIKNGITINFAYRTFRWDSEANLKAHVHCVIIGFSFENSKEKEIYLNESQKAVVKNINPYLIDAPTVFIENRKTPLCNVSEMVFGNMANDSGNFILSEEEAEQFIKKEPLSKDYIKLFLGSEEFINNKKRYCLWLKNAEPSELRKMKLVTERVENVRKIRSESKRDATKKLAETPALFGEIRQPESGTYLLVPRVSSEKRRYVPIGFMDYDVIASDAVQIIPNASLYEFGIMTSNVHNAWMRVVGGRLKSDYRYSASIVYNNFPWPSLTSEQKAEIEKTAKSILDAREKFPKSSLADLYDDKFMPKELLEAHRANDVAVCHAYGFSKEVMKSESKCVAELFKLYEKLVNESKK